MNKIIYILLVFACWGCSERDSDQEKYQKKRNNVRSVKEAIKEIQIEEVLIGRSSQMSLMSDFLIIGDYRSTDKLVHLFDKNTFSYLVSVADLGQGPGEIANMGHIGVNETDRIFYVSDHGKQKIFSYELDSVFANPHYFPNEKMNMNERQFPADYRYICDDICIGLIIEPTGNVGFNQSLAKWNMATGEIEKMKYEHPEIEKRRFGFDVSIENGIYVECHSRHDLMTICDLDGELKWNIYGKWDKQTVESIRYYGDVRFCGDRIYALYSGEKAYCEEKNKVPKTIFPTKFLVFDIEGNYIETLETGYQIRNFCYDKENNRILMGLDDEIQFAYLALAQS